MECGMMPPKYVRAVKISNQSNSNIIVTAYFKSGININYEIPINSTIDIEKGVEHDSYVTVDPIIRIEAKNKSSLLESIEFFPKGVEIHEYNLIEKDNKLLFERTEKDNDL